MTDWLTRGGRVLLPLHYAYDVTPRVTRRDEEPAEVLGQRPSGNEMLYEIGPCITSWSHKATHVYLLRDIWTRHLLVRSGDGRALISIAEAARSSKVTGLASPTPYFIFPRASLLSHL